jgi:D-alanyl-lipoteichoic acid acyltransferase DltB (MBOAT superfamily)
MVFNSLGYAVFLPLVFVVYWRLRHRQQNLFILIASWAFYAFFDWRFLGLLLLSTIVDFWLGHVLVRAPADTRLRWLIASLAVNLGILGAFKYFDFFVGSAFRLLDHLGLGRNPPLMHVVLPIGISFYTFHGISYVFDVYRGRIRPTDNLVDYAVFVAFFPQLVAGPIGRATIQLPQFEQERVRPDGSQVGSALALIILGLFKKVVIADGVAHVANTAFGAASTAAWTTLGLGALAFSLQIYGDFSGYSDIARGSARLLGIELPHNFTEPYLSRNITEFWQRWHISLSRWLRDYLYVPLGGNRGSRPATYRNLMIVMLLGGLWHGASWTFVVWGGAHGAALAVHRAWSTRGGRTGDEPAGLGIPSRVATFALVTVIWILFRAPNFHIARVYLTGMATFRSGPSWSSDDVVLVLAAAVAALAVDLACRYVREHGLQAVLDRRPLAELAVGAAVLGIIVFSGGAPTPFIYFRF